MKLVGLLLFFFSFSSQADELKLHLMRSPLGINWSTPWRLVASTLKNQLAPVGDKRAFSISHVFVEVKCDSIGKHIYRGMTSDGNTEERDLVFKKKYGLGTMFHFFKGKLEKDQDVITSLAPYNGHYRRAELAIKVSPKTCERLLDYAQEYEDLGYGKMYSGLQADPLKQEGAGCSAFAVSFLRVGGLMDNFTEEWKQIIDVPKRFVGGPLTGNRVGVTKILSRPGARWSNREPHIHLEAWDPEAMHSWVGKTYHKIRNGSYNEKWPANIKRDRKTLKVELDMSERETPSGEFWL